MSEEIQVGQHTIELSSLDRLYYPQDGLSKGDVVNYYRRIADIMLPHMQGRPLTMHRFPEGIDDPGFYQKEAPDYFPDWIRRVTVEVEEENGAQEQITCENAATLVYLANQGCLTPHIWLSRADRLDYPDKLIFDLDPGTADFDRVRETALLLQEVLQELGLVPFVMTTGSRGLHVAAPLERQHNFDFVRDFTRDLSELLVRRQPERLTLEMRKSQRRDRLFMDYLRNSYAQNSVAPYSLRARPGAPVATPLDWHEVHSGDLRSQSYTIHNIFRRLGQKEDPWRDFLDHARPLDPARQKLDQLLAAES